MHLHNSLILGLLYNASADVPGPSAARPAPGNLRPHHDADGMRRDGGNDVVARLLSDTEDGDASLAPPKKRLRLLTAGLSRKERARIRSIPKTLVHTQAQGGDGASSLGWAGAGADMLEKKRKEEEKRKSAHEKKRAKEAYSEIGAHDWKARALKSTAEVNDARDRLALCEYLIGCVAAAVATIATAHLCLLLPLLNILCTMPILMIQLRSRNLYVPCLRPCASNPSNCQTWTQCATP